MPRRARLTLPGIPWHIIQRGNNRTACFYTEEGIEELTHPDQRNKVAPTQTIVVPFDGIRSYWREAMLKRKGGKTWSVPCLVLFNRSQRNLAPVSRYFYT
jgi:hypothetical protein